ncbi:hypothetical protein ZIOFF_047349 [Zingiber officinale]|uniref:Pentatricopeptide repeat-containing protein n=1 Tax=Zingiber officinale TaxID=94328 RepID=A0A8J5FP08_ZINOF|nr:hypothetical protein ZIOFF_047349 [Zingiber officinale]
MLYLSSDANRFTLSSLMSSIVNVIEQFHSLTIALGLDSYVFVNNTLISSYSKGDFLVEVEPVFNEMFCKRVVVSWNCMIATFGQHRWGLKALTYLRHRSNLPTCYNTLLSALATANSGTYACDVLVRKCFKIDMLKLANMFTTFMVMKDLADDAQYHVHMTKNDFARKSHFDSDLIDLYLKVSWIVDAMKVFKEVDDPDLVVWNMIISGYLLNDEFLEQGLKLL